MADTARNTDRPNKDRSAVQSGLSDLLGNVIRNDRQQAGRGKAPVQQAESPADERNGEMPSPALPSIAAPQEAAAEIPSAPLPTASLFRVTAAPFDNKTDTQYDIMTNGLVDIPAAAVAPAAPDPLRRKARPASSSGNDHASARVVAAQELAATATMTVTLRIPQGFNDWLDEYIHRSWPQKIRKQELVVEALRLLYARRGKAGEALVETVLLGDDSTE